EAGDEILILAGRHAVLQTDADDLVAGALGSVPGAVLGGKGITAILRRKIVAVIEGEPERSRVRLNEHIEYGDLVLQIRPLFALPRLLVGTEIVPWPAVEGVLLYPRDIVGHEIVTQAVALVGRAPRRAIRLHREPDAIADAGREQPLVLAAGIERQHRGAVDL